MKKHHRSCGFVVVLALVAGCKVRGESSEALGIQSKANETAECRARFEGFAPGHGLFAAGADVPASIRERFTLATVLANGLGRGGRPASDDDLKAALKGWLAQWESGAYAPDDFWRDAQGPLLGLDYVGPKALPKATGLHHALGLDESSWDGSPADLPFPLVAVVNRLDLWTGDPADAGETRLVFGHARKTMLVILELKNPPIPAQSMAEGHVACVAESRGAPAAELVKYWGCRWRQIGVSPAFDTDLGALLDDVTNPAAAQAFSFASDGVIKPGTDRGGRIRTDDFLTSLGWELREFKIQDARIKPTTAKQALSLGNLLSPPKSFEQDVKTNALRIADGQAIDGFFPFQRGQGEHVSRGSSTAWAGMYEDTYKPAFDKAFKAAPEGDPLVTCVAQGTSLPGPIRALVNQQATPKAKFHAAALNGLRLASCTGCHNHPAAGTLAEGSDPTSGKFMHVDTHGQVSAFVTAELPERQAFLEKAVCDPNPTFVTTKCFDLNGAFPARQITQ